MFNGSQVHLNFACLMIKLIRVESWWGKPVSFYDHDWAFSVTTINPTTIINDWIGWHITEQVDDYDVK